MSPKWFEIVTGSLDDKRRYKQLRARLDALPQPWGAAAKAVQRYLMYYGGTTDGDTILRRMTDFVELWEQAAADGTSVRDIVGTEPVEFAEEFARAYDGRQWIDRERDRLKNAISRAEDEEDRP